MEEFKKYFDDFIDEYYQLQDVNRIVVKKIGEINKILDNFLDDLNERED